MKNLLEIPNQFSVEQCAVHMALIHEVRVEPEKIIDSIL